MQLKLNQLALCEQHSPFKWRQGSNQVIRQRQIFLRQNDPPFNIN